MPDEITEPVVETPPAEVVETPATEVVAETPPTEPVVPAAPAHDWADEAVQQRAAEALGRLEKWGSAEDVEQALQIKQALATEEGVTNLFVQAGKALGISADKLEALFGPEAPAVGPEVEEEDEDRVLTVKELREILREKVEAPREQEQTERQVSAAREALNSTLGSLGVKDDAEVRSVLALAQAHIADDDLDPEHIKAAIRKGHAEHSSLVEKRSREYIEKKLQDQQNLPGSIAATAPGGVELPEPTNVEEAKKRVRARFLGK